MLSISSSPPVAWSPAPAPAVAPVSAAVAVTPVQPVQRDAQAGMGSSGQDRSLAAEALRATLSGAAPSGEPEAAEADTYEAAPLLPRPQADGEPGSEAQELPTEPSEAEREDQQARQAEEKAFRQQLQDVITNAWKASAAVVDRALGLEGEDTPAVDTARAAATLDGVRAPTGARAQAANDDVAELAELRAQQEVVAYDAQGHSSLAPLEAGTLVSRRV